MRRRRGRPPGLALGVALVLLATGCRGGSEAVGCTDAGCGDSIGLQLTDTGLALGDPLDVELCLDDRCARVEGDLDEMRWVGGDADEFGPGAAINATLEGDVLLVILDAGRPGTLRDASGELRVDVRSGDAEVAAFTEAVSAERFQPNGPDCEPTCWIVRLERSAA